MGRQEDVGAGDCQVDELFAQVPHACHSQRLEVVERAHWRKSRSQNCRFRVDETKGKRNDVESG